MSGKHGIQQNHRQLLSLCLVLTCLTGAILAQTFQYSRGWTNGKKRSSSVVPFVFQETSEGQEVLGICQMQRLREILQGRHRDQIYLPCEVIGKPEDEITERFRRKTEYEPSSILESIPAQQN